MGLNDFSIYLDSCLAIYLVEENTLFAPTLETELAKYPLAQICVSPLTEMECLIMPLRQQNKPLIAKFENWFAQFEILTIEREAFQQAAQMRADFPSLKSPDAIHLATANYHKCDEFWTNDNRLNKVFPNFSKNVLAPSII